MTKVINGTTKRIGLIVTIAIGVMAIFAGFATAVIRWDDVDDNRANIAVNATRIDTVEPKVEAHTTHLTELATRIEFSREVQIDILKANTQTQQEMKAMRRDMADGFKEVLTELAKR